MKETNKNKYKKCTSALDKNFYKNQQESCVQAHAEDPSSGNPSTSAKSNLSKNQQKEKGGKKSNVGAPLFYSVVYLTYKCNCLE